MAEKSHGGSADTSLPPLQTRPEESAPSKPHVKKKKKKKRSKKRRKKTAKSIPTGPALRAIRFLSSSSGVGVQTPRADEIDVQFNGNGSIGVDLKWIDSSDPPTVPESGGGGLAITGFPSRENGEPSLAAASGLLHLGSVLTAVNGRSVAGLPFDAVTSQLERLQQPRVLRFRRPESVALPSSATGSAKGSSAALEECTGSSSEPQRHRRRRRRRTDSGTTVPTVDNGVANLPACLSSSDEEGEEEYDVYGKDGRSDTLSELELAFAVGELGPQSKRRPSSGRSKSSRPRSGRSRSSTGSSGGGESMRSGRSASMMVKSVTGGVGGAMSKALRRMSMTLKDSSLSSKTEECTSPMNDPGRVVEHWLETALAEELASSPELWHASRQDFAPALFRPSAPLGARFAGHGGDVESLHIPPVRAGDEGNFGFGSRVEVTNRSSLYESRRRLGASAWAWRGVEMNKNTNRWESRVYKARGKISGGGHEHLFVGTFDDKIKALKAADHAALQRDRSEKLGAGSPKGGGAGGSVVDSESVGSPGSVSGRKAYAQPPLPPGTVVARTNLNITVVSDSFQGMGLWERRMVVYSALISVCNRKTVPHTVAKHFPASLNRAARPSSGESSRSSISPKRGRKSTSGASPGRLSPLAMDGVGANWAAGAKGPTQMKGTAYFGDEMRALPLFKFLPCYISIVCKTMSQWRPAKYSPSFAERFGSSGLGLRNAGVDRYIAKGFSTTDLQRLFACNGPLSVECSRGVACHALTCVFLPFVISAFFFPQEGKGGGLTKRPISAGERVEKGLSVSAGVALVGGIRSADGCGSSRGGGRKAGRKGRRRKSTSFNDPMGLTADTKKMLEAQRRESVRAERRRSASVESSKSKGLDALAFNPLEQASGNYEDKISPEMNLWLKKREMSRAASALQRIWRDSLHGRFVRHQFRLNLCALHIQRTYRGHLGLKRYWTKRIQDEAAALPIQASWRMLQGRRDAARKRKALTEAVLRIQPIVRGLRARKLVAWMRRDNWASLKVQRAVRGYFARNRFKKLLARRFHERTVVPAVITLQAALRGMRDRTLVRAIRDEKWHREFVVPAVHMLQQCWRSKMSRMVLAELKARKWASTLLQRVLRGRIARRKYLSMQAQVRLEVAATRMAAVVRGRICRQLAELRADKKYFEEVTVPAASTIQALWRARAMRVEFALVIMRARAVVVIQRAWRALIARRTALRVFRGALKAYHDKLVTAVQSRFRGHRQLHRDRKLVAVVARQRDAERVGAVFVMQTAWRAYVKRIQEHAEKQKEESEEYFKVCEGLQQELDWLEDDVGDVRDEQKRHARYIKKTHKLIRSLKEDRREMERRLPVVEQEIENLDEKDIEGGWAEAYETEWDTLSNRFAMSGEEIHGKKISNAEREHTMENLGLELDDLELDIDDQSNLMMQAHEKHRQYEIARCTERFKFHRAALIRKQKNRWRIKEVRTKVIARAVQDAREEALENDEVPEDLKMSSNEAQTITYAKQKKFEQRVIDRNAAADYRNKFDSYEETRKQGEFNPAMRKTFDNAVEQMRQVTLDFTYDMRRPKIDRRADPNFTCQDCGLTKVLCKCEEEEEELL